MENKQTAVEWLIEKLESQYIKTTGGYDVKMIIGIKDIEQAKEIEKEQIIKAIIDQYTNGDLSAEQYYNKYYGK
jgi:hypothetical protein